VRVDVLATPTSDGELWDLEDEALRLHPFMTGDVFTGVDDGDDGDPTQVMIIAHPCVIRGSRGRLARRVPCCVVKQTQAPLSYKEWPERGFHLFPVTDAIGLGEHYAAYLLEWRSIHYSELRRDRRCATMTDRGVYILLQRFTHAITRCAPLLVDFEAAALHEMREAELEYEWVAEIAGGSDDAAVESQVRAFHTFLEEGGYRELLRQEGGDARLRAIVRMEIKRHLEEGSSSD
jgi:hypothetical protein